MGFCLEPDPQSKGGLGESDRLGTPLAFCTAALPPRARPLGLCACSAEYLEGINRLSFKEKKKKKEAKGHFLSCHPQPWPPALTPSPPGSAFASSAGAARGHAQKAVGFCCGEQEQRRDFPEGPCPGAAPRERGGHVTPRGGNPAGKQARQLPGLSYGCGGQRDLTCPVGGVRGGRWALLCLPSRSLLTPWARVAAARPSQAPLG